MIVMRAALIFLFALAGPQVASADPLEERRGTCLGWMVSGYPSGIEETACTAQFSLPSPFLFKCMRGTRLGFDSDLQRRACVDYLARASTDMADSYIREN